MPDSKKVIIFTALNHGGILQLANQMALTLKNIGREFSLYVPVGSKNKCVGEVLDSVVEYNLPKFSFSVEKRTKELAAEIIKSDPGCFIAVDDAIKASAVVSALSKKIKCAIVIHDVNPHPQKKTLYKEISEFVRKTLAKQAYRRAGKVILLSENSYRIFCKCYPQYVRKTVIFPLGAHVMPASPIVPEELNKYKDLDGFALFFGRIDKYKGVDRLVRVQAENCLDKKYTLPLVIAGKNLSGEHFRTSDKDHTVCLTRFISDGEMIWLFQHCGVVVLPYYEASQSGVLPIAYKYGKPVIVSNINGLQELVIENRTGFVFKDDAELGKLLYVYNIDRSGKENQEIREYYNETYDWNKNILILLERILETNE